MVEYFSGLDSVGVFFSLFSLHVYYGIMYLFLDPKPFRFMYLFLDLKSLISNLYKNPNNDFEGRISKADYWTLPIYSQGNKIPPLIKLFHFIILRLLCLYMFLCILTSLLSKLFYPFLDLDSIYYNELLFDISLRFYVGGSLLGGWFILFFMLVGFYNFFNEHGITNPFIEKNLIKKIYKLWYYLWSFSFFGVFFFFGWFLILNNIFLWRPELLF